MQVSVQKNKVSSVMSFSKFHTHYVIIFVHLSKVNKSIKLISIEHVKKRVILRERVKNFFVNGLLWYSRVKDIEVWV